MSTTLSVSGYGTGSYANCQRSVTATISVTGPNTISFTIHSTSSSSQWPKTRIILLINDQEAHKSEYNSTFSGSVYPNGRDCSYSGSYTSNGLDTTKSFTAFLGVRISQDSSYTDTASTTVAAEYTITYNANGGTGAPSPQTYTYASSGSITLSSTTPVKNGYKFLGWSLSSTATSPSYSPGQQWQRSNNSNYTLYAVWEQSGTLTVNYYSNYATKSFSDALNTVGKDKNVLVRITTHEYATSQPDGLCDYSLPTSSTYLARDGYSNEGNWGTELSGGYIVNEITSFSSGQALAQALGKDLSSGDATVNVYPQWIANTYKLTYDGNGGTRDVDPEEESADDTTWSTDVTYDSEIFIRTNDDLFYHPGGLKFVGWNTAKDGSGEDWTDKAGTTITWEIASDVTLYAQWSTDVSYKVTFDANGGKFPDGSTKVVRTVPLGGSAALPDDPTRDGKVFKGWVGTYTNITSNQIVHANWDTGVIWIMTDQGWRKYE